MDVIKVTESFTVKIDKMYDSKICSRVGFFYKMTTKKKFIVLEITLGNDEFQESRFETLLRL